jgi:hypothetical protein
MHRIVTSYTSKTRNRAIQEFLLEFREREVLLVAPSRQAADDAVRNLVVERGAVSGVHRFTMASLALEIANPRLATTGTTIISGVAHEAMAARATERCRARAALRWFDPVARTPGFFRALAATISEIRANDIDPQRLGDSGPAGSDLAELIREYDAALKENRMADLAAIYGIAAGEFSRYRKMPLVLMDIHPASLLERRFIASLSESSPAAVATLHQRDQRAIEILQTIFRSIASPTPDERADALDRLRQNAFSLRAPASGKLDNSVGFRSASDESRECVEIARSILTAAAENDLRFDRIAVALRNPDLYQPLLEDALRRAGIPAFYTQGTKRPNPAGRAFLALLACASEGLAASRFAEYLSLGQVPDPEEPTEPKWVPVQGQLFAEAPVEPVRPPLADIVRAPQAWERLLVDAAVIGGSDRWERRLGGLDRELEKQINELRAEDETRLAQLERQRARLADLRRFALPLIERLARLPQFETWDRWLDALEELAAKSLRQAEGVLGVLAELRPMADIGPIALDEVREVLTHRLTFLRTETGERRYGKVFVATISEIAGLSFHTVFLPGLGEDIFPKRTFEDPLLLDDARRTISSDLTTQDGRVTDERLLFHTGAAAAERQLVISYPRMNLAQGRPRGPSFYAMEVVRSVTGRVPNLHELQRVAAESSESQAGWPAPRDPARAIDDAEYDLAAISQMLRMPIEAARGRGRYLIHMNENLARSLRTRAGRWRARWTEGDGIIDADAATLAILANQRIAARPYSATALQQFAACPYKFLLSAVHRLQPRDQVAALERLDPLTRGSLFHSIQFHLLSQLRSRDLLPITAANLAQVFEIADEVIDRTARLYQDDLAPAIQRIWEGEVEDVRWDVRGWIREMIQPEGTTAWTPRWFELSFGLPRNRDCDPASAKAPLDLPAGLHLRGSIDMIEERAGQLRVTDHKTGKAPAIPPVFTGKGEVLQPLLYARAAESLLHKPVESARLFYCTEKGGYRSLEVPVNDESQAALDRVIQTVDQYLETGFLPAAPREGACTWCDYQMICGPYEEVRTRRKPAARLEALQQIRKS